MIMNRRNFSAAMVAGAAASLISTRGIAANPAPTKARNVVLVHGLFADGSSWSEVIARLQAAGLNATAVQNPLTTLPEGVASAERVLARPDGPTVLVGHSFSGMIVTEAGVHPNVSALVYVAARAPDAGEDYTALAKTFPTPPASAGIVFDGDEGRLSEEAFLRDFAGDLPAAKAKVLYAVQQPGAGSFSRSLLDGEHPHDAALRHVILEAGDLAGQCVLNALGIDTPARLDGDILRAVHLIGDRHGHDAGVGLLLPEQFAGLGMEGAEHPGIGAADKDEVAGGSRAPT